MLDVEEAVVVVLMAEEKGEPDGGETVGVVVAGGDSVDVKLVCVSLLGIDAGVEVVIEA